MNEHLRTCEKCGAYDALPYFTKLVKEVKGEDDYQPRWFCKRHKPRKRVMGV